MTKAKAALGLSVLLSVGFAAYVQWSSIVPDQKTAQEMIEMQNIDNHESVVGDATTSAYIYTVETLLNKNGGYHLNDIAVKMGIYDNMPMFERGVVIQARELSYVMRDRFSRSDSNDQPDPSLKKVQPAIHFDDEKWNPFANTEGEFQKSVVFAKEYLDKISNPSARSAQFYTRADYLREYLDKVSQKLGGLSKTLSGSTGEVRENTDLANDPSARQSTVTESTIFEKTDWLLIDNVYWEARGQTWALIHYLRAIEVDFHDTLAKKNAIPTVRKIIQDLERTQESLSVPVVLNGSGFGIWANHSLTMANYISRAQATVNELQKLLDNG